MAKNPVKRKERNPVRKVVTPRTTKSVYLMPSRKNERSVGGASLAEHVLQILHEVDNTVQSYFEQPETIKWRDKAGVKHTHTPDLESIDNDKRKYLYEVKPDGKVESFRERTEILTEQLAAKGVIYSIRESGEILLEPRRTNALTLWDACNPWVVPNEHLPMAVSLAFDQRNPRTFGELLEIVDSFVNDPDELLQLAATGRFSIDIVTCRLGSNSPVSASPIYPCAIKIEKEVM
ncbi:Tn7 transposase TnsA N-terminal domain-containing protein [Ferrovibrio terrae]|uniref:Tn7 transposase TnsA N-terminal domain-containing protein n=1 Tax=Ferrovibrio terrae TaxID=2594003 RepID=UPI0031380D50